MVHHTRLLASVGLAQARPNTANKTDAKFKLFTSCIVTPANRLDTVGG